MKRASAAACSLAGLGLAILTTACAAAPRPGPAGAADPALPPAANDTCGAALFAELIGTPIGGPSVPVESRLNRHIRPDTRVTMDYIAQRMNIEADAQGVIRRLTCG